jgi:hypothetical protein
VLGGAQGVLGGAQAFFTKSGLFTGAQGVLHGGQQGVINTLPLEQSEKPSSAMGDSASASPSTLSQPAATPPPQLDEAPAAAAEQPANDNFASDAVFEELAQELESDPSSSLLNELQDLCSFETQNNVSANFAQSTSYVNDDELFLSLERGLIPGADGGVGEEKESLLAELSAMGHDEPLTLTFGDFPIEGLHCGLLARRLTK